MDKSSPVRCSGLGELWYASGGTEKLREFDLTESFCHSREICAGTLMSQRI